MTIIDLCCSALPSSGHPHKDGGQTAFLFCPCSKGMMAWIAQGLEKVVPQPDLKSKESAPAEQPAEVHQLDSHTSLCVA